MDGSIHDITPVGHQLYCLARVVPAALCLVVEAISRRAVGGPVSDHDVWHAGFIR